MNKTVDKRVKKVYYIIVERQRTNISERRNKNGNYRKKYRKRVEN